MTAAASVAEISDADIPEVAEFLARQVRPGEAVARNPLAPARRLNWLLLDNPARDPAVPLGWRIRGQAGQVVGAALCIPFRVGTPTFSTTALMFAKFFVDPPYRGMGLGLLMRFVGLGKRFGLFVTSTNAVAGTLFSRVGASVIPGMDHTMLGVARLDPPAEEWLYRRTGNRALARLGAMPARLVPGRRGKIAAGAGELHALTTADQAAAIEVAMPADVLAIVRDRSYLHWRYFSVEADQDAYCFRFPGETDRLAIVNQVRSGYRGQIRVLNVLDVWPPASAASAPALVAELTGRYRGMFDVLWLRSQPVDAEVALSHAGLIRHAFPAPLGWWIDRGKMLPSRNWYLMPGESE